jgi:Uma2 family endonuclease
VPATNVRLVIEVSDATLSRDLTTKAVLYAGAAIPEYWVVDLIGRRLLIHGMPGSNGYAQVTEYHDTETAVPLFDSMAAFAVADILP